ncbi:hypothetical protein ENTCAN_08787 [Enterobacter cancerogenus ATCC 35316]|nr:hypothetical protein ENTCAN_08787 [Enterobacter cancerogenus ATCC 35316]
MSFATDCNGCGMRLVKGIEDEKKPALKSAGCVTIYRIRLQPGL